jgi:L-ascorbate metabolism protein UlaG (beta-lactamase superfamily)
LHNGDETEAGGIKISAVPAYNRVRERAPGLKFHPEGTGNGYVADFGGFRLYIAGDTEAIPEMSRLKDIDVALLPVMLPYTMSPEEAAQAARSFQPKIVLPYHCTKRDAQQTAQLLANTAIEVRVVIPV